jgi:hypothetical protein
MIQLELYGISKDVAPELILAVLKQYAPDKLMNVFERNSLLRHVQIGGEPSRWYNWYEHKNIAPAQMPALFAALAAKDAALDAIAALQPEDEDAPTN